MPIEEDSDLLPYAVHETYLGGMLGIVVSRHETFEAALAIATKRDDKSRAIVYRRQIVWPKP